MKAGSDRDETKDLGKAWLSSRVHRNHRKDSVSREEPNDKERRGHFLGSLEQI